MGCFLNYLAVIMFLYHHFIIFFALLYLFFISLFLASALMDDIIINFIYFIRQCLYYSIAYFKYLARYNLIDKMKIFYYFKKFIDYYLK